MGRTKKVKGDAHCSKGSNQEERGKNNRKENSNVAKNTTTRGEMERGRRNDQRRPKSKKKNYLTINWREYNKSKWTQRVFERNIKSIHRIMR